jgi:hypothetical protein
MAQESLAEMLGMEPSQAEKTAARKAAALDAVGRIYLNPANETGEWVDSPSELSEENFERNQIIEACRTQLNFLASMAMPDDFKVLFSPTHLTMWEILISTERDEDHAFPQLALGIPRGHAKTTMIKLFILYCILYTKRRFILVTAATEQHAINIITDVCDMLGNDNMIAVFGDYKLGMETDTKALKKFGFMGRNIIIFAIGAEGAVRGSNIKNSRPDVIVMDDIQTKE